MTCNMDILYMSYNIITFTLHIDEVFGILHFFWCTALHMYKNTQTVIECTKFTISSNGLAVNGASMLVSESITSGLSSLYNSIVTKCISWNLTIGIGSACSICKVTARITKGKTTNFSVDIDDSGINYLVPVMMIL